MDGELHLVALRSMHLVILWEAAPGNSAEAQQAPLQPMT